MTDTRTINERLSGIWCQKFGTAPCPVCQPEGGKEQNALTLADGTSGRILPNCKKSGCAFLAILAAAGVRSVDYTSPDAATLAQCECEAKAEAAKRAAQAKRHLGEAQPITGKVAEAYLRWRGMSCDLPPTLRFYPDCLHGPTAESYRAMLAAVQGSDVAAVHRNYLRDDGSGKAEIAPNKMMLENSGGPVRVTKAQVPLVVAEGIETALSLASGLCLPPSPGRLTIATDGNAAGADAGRDLAERAHANGCAVSMLPAPKGRNWNDILTGKAVLT
ncbi:virulence-associated protein E [Roseobacter sp. AzwK-3b]|uniref:DUF7146 domain-containing protein n=1 Tax=Roseobacter sp. AzwK-3b TaxID=351016 RepID=UPI0001568E28|nr:toprim domain-containing protein [Roseobacter sp. AzwK-3b]EDM73194.1 virulence-associated protein E [Roseobacter sp. AzwK-3b]